MKSEAKTYPRFSQYLDLVSLFTLQGLVGEEEEEEEEGVLPFQPSIPKDPQGGKSLVVALLQIILEVVVIFFVVVVVCESA